MTRKADKNRFQGVQFHLHLGRPCIPPGTTPPAPGLASYSASSSHYHSPLLRSLPHYLPPFGWLAGRRGRGARETAGRTGCGGGTCAAGRAGWNRAPGARVAGWQTLLRLPERTAVSEREVGGRFCRLMRCFPLQEGKHDGGRSPWNQTAGWRELEESPRRTLCKRKACFSKTLCNVWPYMIGLA